MRRFLQVIVAFALAFTALAFLFPRDSVDRTIAFDASTLPDDLDVYLATEEAKFADITQGSSKRIVWVGAAGVKTPLAIIYIHGFSATAEEIRPVPDMVAQAMGANLFYTRLAGHGRTGAAMGEVVAGDWVEDRGAGGHHLDLNRYAFGCDCGDGPCVVGGVGGRGHDLAEPWRQGGGGDDP
jgi:hypothetical protein